MLPDDLKIYDVDAHVLEPRGVWVDRMPAKYQDLCPRVEEREGKKLAWMFEGREYPFGMVGTPTTQNFRGDGINEFVHHYDDLIPAASDPAARLEALDTDGIWAQMSFPSFPRFAGTLFLESQDKELGLLSVQAYNDWMIDEWCGVNPDRMLALVILPLWDPQAAAAEIHRVAERDAKAISFPEHPVPLGLPSFWTNYWDPVFAAAQETNLPLCTHIGTQGSLMKPSPESAPEVTYSLSALNAMCSVTDFIFADTFGRFPGLKVVLSEAGGGWVPYICERMDYTFSRARTGVKIAEKPSVVFKEHFWSCIIEDYVAVRNRYDIRVDRLLFESDFPHQDGNYPHTRKILEDMMVGVPADEVRQIAELNARALFDR